MKGYVNIALAIPKITVSDIIFNTQKIESMMAEADGKGADIVVFPELSITSASCGDLFLQSTLVEQAEHALLKIIEFSHNISIVTIVGIPIMWQDRLFNCAAIISEGKIFGLVPKISITNNVFTAGNDISKNAIINVFGQQVPINSNLIFNCGKCKFGIQFEDDLLAPYAHDRSLVLNGADIIVTLSSGFNYVGHYSQLKNILQVESFKTKSAYLFVSSGYGESSQDCVSIGTSLLLECGEIVIEGDQYRLEDSLNIGSLDINRIRLQKLRSKHYQISKSRQKDLLQNYIEVDLPEKISFDQQTFARTINPLPFIPKDNSAMVYNEIVTMQSMALAKRIEYTKADTVVLGVSGGLDSTLALLVCVNTFDLIGKDRNKIIGVTMPGFGTSGRTHSNALQLMELLGITIKEVPIREACEVHFNDIALDPQLKDSTFENAQARERTQILMDLAGMWKGFVVGTGDLSELALGWTTYNGDHMSMYGINASLPKTVIREIVHYLANQQKEIEIKQILLDVVNTPISPELLPVDENNSIQQKTEDIVGPYELHDFFLYQLLYEGFRIEKIFKLALKAFDGSDVRVAIYDEKTIAMWLKIFVKRFFSQQFKRSCMPDGAKVYFKSLSPRGDWAMPSDAEVRIWIEEIDKLLKEQN